MNPTTNRRGGRGHYHDVKHLRPLVLSTRVRDSLTRADVRLLERLEREHRVDVAELDPSHDAERVLWLAYFGFLSLLVDAADRVYVVRNPEALPELRGELTEKRA